MFAYVSSIAFAGAAYLAANSVMTTLQDNRSRIADALRGRPLERISPLLSAAA